MNVRLDAEWLKEWFALELATLADAQKQVRDARGNRGQENQEVVAGRAG